MQLKNFFKDTKSIIISIIGTFVLLESLAVIAVGYAKNTEINNYLSLSSPDFKSHINIANSYLSEVSKIFYDLKINKPEITDIMYLASKEKDKVRLDLLRKKLFKKLGLTYKYMHKYNVRQLHFQLPKEISFLRFHRPNMFGDSLVGIRKTLEYVNENRTPISAFEEGRIFNGFRNVYPIYKGKEFVGTVEISFSFSAMQEILSRIDSTTYLFMINKKIVDKKVFASEKSNYESSEFKSYYYDKNTLKDTTQISLKEVDIINKDILEKVNKRIKNDELFSIYYNNKDVYDGHSIVISFAPVSNLDNKVVAYIVHYLFTDFIDIINRNMQLLFIALSMLAFILTALFALVLFNERKKQKAIHDLVVHDALTKIYNRHGVNEILNQKLEEFKRDKRNLSIIFFDIDLFKNVNDVYGHDIGDYVLENITKLVSAEIRSSDIFARWGGEEFIIFLPNTKIDNAKEIAEKLRQIIEEHSFSSVEKVTCSFGVTQLLEDDTKTSFLKRVDELLYKAKNNGRNCVVSALNLN